MPEVLFWDLEKNNITAGWSLISTNVKQKKMKGLGILGGSILSVIQQYEMTPTSLSCMYILHL